MEPFRVKTKFPTPQDFFEFAEQFSNRIEKRDGVRWLHFFYQEPKRQPGLDSSTPPITFYFGARLTQGDRFAWWTNKDNMGVGEIIAELGPDDTTTLFVNASDDVWEKVRPCWNLLYTEMKEWIIDTASEQATPRQDDKSAPTEQTAGGAASERPQSAQADVLIVTVTRIESKAVFDVFQSATGRAHEPATIYDQVYHILGVINGATVYLVQSEMGAGGLGGAQQTVQKAVAAISPLAVIMVGVAFGVDKGKQAIGDILVSERLMLYEPERVGTEEDKARRISRGDRAHASVRLLRQCRSADLNWDQTKAEVRFGLILSGDKLVDNMDFRSQLLALEPEAIGGEMEGAGLYVACQDAKVDWILVKAICDWADGHKSVDKDQRHQLAAHNAAAFALYMLQHAPLKHRDPSSGAGPRVERELIEREAPSRGAAETNGQSGGVEIKGEKVAVGGDLVRRDKVIHNLNQHNSQPEIALDMCLLADNFIDEFRRIGSSWVSGSEVDHLKGGQNVFAVRQNTASETLEKLTNLSRRAKYLLDCGELVEENVAALRRVFSDYSLNLESYIQQSRVVGEQLRSGIFISKNADAPRMQLIEELFGSGWQEYFNSLSELVQDMTGLLKKYTIR